MKRRFLAGAACAGALAVGGLALAAAPIKLTGAVGPGFTIGLKNAKGQKVTTLKPGRYTFAVSDKSDIHDFHLKGPGVSKEITDVEFKGAKSVTLTLKAGKYTYLCTVHGFKGTFTVK